MGVPINQALGLEEEEKERSLAAPEAPVPVNGAPNPYAASSPNPAPNPNAAPNPYAAPAPNPAPNSNAAPVPNPASDPGVSPLAQANPGTPVRSPRKLGIMPDLAAEARTHNAPAPSKPESLAKAWGKDPKAFDKPSWSDYFANLGKKSSGNSAVDRLIQQKAEAYREGGSAAYFQVSKDVNPQIRELENRMAEKGQEAWEPQQVTLRDGRKAWTTQQEGVFTYEPGQAVEGHRPLDKAEREYGLKGSQRVDEDQTFYHEGVFLGRGLDGLKRYINRQKYGAPTVHKPAPTGVDEALLRKEGLD